jgi:3-dehydroquinate dehydratase-2
VPAFVVAVLHGPNLNLLGRREPELYGRTTLATIDRTLGERAAARGASVECLQSNSEGALIDAIQAAGVGGRVHGLIINPGAYTHTSLAIADALRAITLPAVEVHLTNLARREPLRQQSLCGPACVGTIAGFGARSYYLALDALLELLAERAA